MDAECLSLLEEPLLGLRFPAEAAGVVAFGSAGTSRRGARCAEDAPRTPRIMQKRGEIALKEVKRATCPQKS